MSGQLIGLQKDPSNLCTLTEGPLTVTAVLQSSICSIQTIHLIFCSYFRCWLESYVRKKDLMHPGARFHSHEGLLLITCSHGFTKQLQLGETLRSHLLQPHTQSRSR